MKYRILAIAVGALLALAPAVSALAQTTGADTARVIKDPAEYNAYMSALNTADPVAKGAAMEAFAANYPTSVMQIDALQQAMAAFQQAGDTAKVETLARRILAVRPDAVRELGIVVLLVRNRATATADPQAAQALAETAGADAEHGLASLAAWSKPDGLADEDFVKARDQLTSIFNGALGFRSLKRKDYAAAGPYYLAALKVEPDDLTNVYQLAIAKLQSNPVDPAGFWFVARAYALAGAAKNDAAQTSIAAFGRASYRRYHGGEDGWDKLISDAASSREPPAGFAVAAAPTAAELAVKAVADNDPRSLSISDQEFILAQRDASPANRNAAERVWDMIEANQAGGVKLKLPMKVIAATADGFDAAITDDNQEAGRADVHVKFNTPGAKSPAPGTMVQVVGRFSGYTPQPFSFNFEADAQ